MPKLTHAEYNFWLAEAESAEKRQKTDLINRNAYPELIRYYEGMLQNKTDTNRVQVGDRMAIINDYFPSINALISEILFQNPEFNPQARKPSAEEGLPLMKSALKYAFEETGSLEENRIATFDALMAGYGCVEVGNAKEAPEYMPLPDEDRQPQGMMDKIKSVFNPANQEEAEEKLAEESPKDIDANESAEQTFIKRVDPLDVLFDWKANRLKDCRYLIKKCQYSVAEFNARYPELKGKVKGTQSIDFAVSDSEKRAVLVYEFQIRKKSKEFWNLAICPGYREDAISYFQRPYITDGFDVKVLTFHKYGKIYPVSVGRVNKTVADNLNDYVEFLKDVAEKNIPKRVISKAKVKEDAKIALNSRIVNDIVEVEGDASSAVINVASSEVSQGNKDMIQLLTNQGQKLWSVSNERLGLSGQAEFATELKIQETGFEMRTNDLQDGLKQLLEEEADAVKDIIYQLWDSPIWMKITEGDGTQWYKPELLGGLVANSPAEVLTGDYDVKVDITTAMRPNSQKDRMDAVEFMKIISDPNVAQVLLSAGYSTEIIVDAIKKVAEKYGVSPDKFQQAQQPMPQGLPVEGMPQGMPEGMPPEMMPQGAGNAVV